MEQSIYRKESENPCTGTVPAGNKSLKPYRRSGLGMVKFSALAMAALLVTALSSCQREGDTETGEPQAARFTSGITTRAAGNHWDGGDEIGIWMVGDGGIIPVDGTENIAYVTTLADGNFEASNPSETIYFPQNGNAVNFIAYYPWTNNASNGTYKIDLSNQANPENIDLLYVHDKRQFSKTNHNVNLTFKHRLARIELETVAGDGLTQTDLAGMKVTIDGMKRKADFDILADGISGQYDEADIAMRPATNGANYEAIILPGQIGGNDVMVEFDVTDVGTFYWSIPTTNFEPGKTYKWKVTVKRNSVSVGNVQIDDWTVVQGGDVDATPMQWTEADLQLPNCYMVKPGQSVEIPVTKAYAVWWLDKTLRKQAPDVNSDAEPVLVWRDIASTSYASFSTVGSGADRKFKIDVGNDEGNFVVAAEIDGEIFWSWHIWVTDYDPENNSGGRTFDYNGVTTMDRNIGAKNATFNDPGTIGLFYQWGRKDPFTGPDTWSDNFRKIWDADGNELTTAELPEIRNTPTETLNNVIFSVRNPNTRIVPGGGNFWGGFYNDIGEAPIDFWEQTLTKHFSDPCPAGWGLAVGSPSHPWADASVAPPVFGNDYCYEVGTGDFFPTGSLSGTMPMSAEYFTRMPMNGGGQPSPVYLGWVNGQGLVHGSVAPNQGGTIFGGRLQIGGRKLYSVRCCKN